MRFGQTATRTNRTHSQLFISLETKDSLQYRFCNDIVKHTLTDRCRHNDDDLTPTLSELLAEVETAIKRLNN